MLWITRWRFMGNIDISSMDYVKRREAVVPAIGNGEFGTKFIAMKKKSTKNLLSN